MFRRVVNLTGLIAGDARNRQHEIIKLPALGLFVLRIADVPPMLVMDYSLTWTYYLALYCGERTEEALTAYLARKWQGTENPLGKQAERFIGCSFSVTTDNDAADDLLVGISIRANDDASREILRQVLSTSPIPVPDAPDLGIIRLQTKQ